MNQNQRENQSGGGKDKPHQNQRNNQRNNNQQQRERRDSGRNEAQENKGYRVILDLIKRPAKILKYSRYF